jgi:predicted lipoprotein with Yx(FWY)xxD motif
MRPTSRFLSLAGLATAALLLAAACSSAATPSATVLGATNNPTTGAAGSQAAGTFAVGATNDATLGAYLTGQNGMTLYITHNDTPDTSSCTGSCSTKWPPLTVAPGTTIGSPSGATGTFTLITRPDGTMQIAYDHQPLYYYSGDSKAGDTTGEGYVNKWYVAPLTASAATPAATAAATPTSASGY